MKFKKYPKLTNAYMIEQVQKFIDTVPSEEQWYVTEKIHGANFQVGWRKDDNGKFGIRLGSRQNFITEDFFGLSASREFTDTLSNITSILSSFTEEAIIYGEVYGSNIQKGIFYSDIKNFIVFDIKVGNTFLPRGAVEDICKAGGVEWCKTIFKGSLKNCLNYSNEFNSLLESELTGEDIRSDNICEGIVIRPEKIYFTDKDQFVAIKNKNDKWTEKSKVAKRDKQSEPSVEDTKLYLKLSELVTANTISSAISKIGRELKFIPALLKEVISDISETVLSEDESLLEKDVKRVVRLCSCKIIILIKEDIKSYKVS